VVIPLLTLPLAARRRRPLLSCLFILTAVAVSSAVLGGGEATTEFLLFIAVAYSGAAYAEHPVLVAAATVAAGAVHEVRDPAVHGPGDVVWALGMVAIAFLLGRAVYARQHRIGALQDEAARRDQEHAQQVAAATAAERAAIARELHDIVAHAVSVVVIQAQAGARTLPHKPELAARTFDTIEDSARTALVELRRLLTVLSGADSGVAAPRPAGSLSQINELVRSFDASGLAIALTMQDPLPQLTPAAELAAYRVVQEALTNAARHARGSHVTVDVAVAGGAVTVRVVNTAGEAGHLAGLGAGRGLIGMRERLHLVGGELVDAAPYDGGFRILASIPLGANEAAPAAESVA